MSENYESVPRVPKMALGGSLLPALKANVFIYCLENINYIIMQLKHSSCKIHSRLCNVVLHGVYEIGILKWLTENKERLLVGG